MKRACIGTLQILAVLVLLLPLHASLASAQTSTIPWVHNPIIYRPASNSNPGAPPYVPSDIWKAYNFLPLYAQGINGTGTRIAIIDAYGSTSITTDLATFNSVTGLPPATLNIHYPDGNPGHCGTTTCRNWATETSLDVEWAHAIAPAATIDLVVALDPSENHIYDAIAYVANTLTSETVLSMSFGLSESQYPTTGTGTIPNTHQLFVIMTSHGTTPFASSGDSGATTCCDVEYPASDPLVVAVGGTSLSLNSTAGYVGETAWSGSTAGSSIVFGKPTYQLGLGDSMRDDVDVSYDGDPNTGFYVVKGNFAYQIGGTSAGAPQWAALTALASQANQTRFGQILPTLYKLNSYHDISTGSDTFFTATTGWDYPTGLGSPDATRLISSLVKTDIAISTLTTSRNFDYSGTLSDPIIVHVTASNNGPMPETFTIALKANSTTVTNQTITVPVTQGIGIQILWNAAQLPRGTYVLSAQAALLLGDTNSTNNSVTDNSLFTSMLRGDINNDCNVNGADLAILGANFLQTPPANAYADFNNDGTINGLDLAILASSFLQSC